MAKAAAVLSKLYEDPTLRNNCSGFVKEATWKVAGRTLLPDLPADKLIEEITTSSQNWKPLGKGPAAGEQAATFAAQGYLVVALLKAADHYPFKYNKITKQYDIRHPYSHGHISIVLAGATRNGFPYVISGSLIQAGQSSGEKSVLGVWREIDAPNVQYYRSAEKYPVLLQYAPSAN